jgi:hypothetical protein
MSTNIRLVNDHKRMQEGMKGDGPERSRDGSEVKMKGDRKWEGRNRHQR